MQDFLGAFESAADKVPGAIRALMKSFRVPPASMSEADAIVRSTAINRFVMWNSLVETSGKIEMFEGEVVVQVPLNALRVVAMYPPLAERRSPASICQMESLRLKDIHAHDFIPDGVPQIVRRES